MSKQQLLRAEVVSSSNSNTWNEARKEWYFESAVKEEEWSSCLCEHPIKEICTIRNRLNGNELDVGNCCVNRFSGDWSKMTRSVNQGKVSKKLISHAFTDGVINEWEHYFLLKMFRKRKLTLNQESKKEQIERIILTRYSKPKKRFKRI